MFDTISDKFQNIFRAIKGHHKISESNISDALREVRKALLEADVNYTVIKTFIKDVKEKALGESVVQSVTPGQMITKIIHDEMVDLLSKDKSELSLNNSLQNILMVGLQGCGKTTTCAKLALWYKTKDLPPLLCAADTQRPAAREQLRVLAKQIGVDFFTIEDEKDPSVIAKKAFEYAKANTQCKRLIIDTAGRLHVDNELMAELVKITSTVKQNEILLTADAMTGQDAVKTAKSFSETLNLTGVVLTKMDGDARGGAIMSMASITGKAIKFVGTGEKIENFEFFHPDRVASRILGMGDIVSLVEKAQSFVDEKEAEKMAKKFKKNQFDFEDFRTSIKQIKKMGSMQSIMKMIPGMPKIDPKDMDEKQLIYVEAMINSMTKKEREKPGIINGSRKKRISKGSGRTVEEVNRLLKQFREMKTMMKRMQKMMGRGGAMSKLPF